MFHEMRLFEDDQPWVQIKDGDPAALELFKQHYSYRPYKDGRQPKLFVGPGEKLVLITKDGRGLFVWRKFISGDGQQGVNCSVFRNTTTHLSSTLILAAEKIALNRWPGVRFYTYVNPKKIANKTNPGFCFKVAGWRVCGETKRNKLLILEKFSSS